MEPSATPHKFKKLTVEYFNEKTKQAKGTVKMLVALEMSNYLREARQQGLSFDELKQLGFKFATA